MAQGGLHQVNRRTPIEAVAGVGVAQPVGRNIGLNAHSLGRRSHNSHQLRGIQVAPLATPKDRVLAMGQRLDRLAIGLEFLPERWRQQHRAGFVALAIDRHLAPIPSGLQISPTQSTKLTSPHPGRIEQSQH